MEKVKLPIHIHPLLPITRFSLDECCEGCGNGYIYGGYRCNELGCLSVFHRKCPELLQEIKHSCHPHHPLKLLRSDQESICSRCYIKFRNGYTCSICDFKLHFYCAKEPAHILEKSSLHKHPLELIFSSMLTRDGSACNTPVSHEEQTCYHCYQCDLVIHEECAESFPEANHTSHPQHSLKILTVAASPSYVDDKCLLCGIRFYWEESFDYGDNKFYHCGVCNFSICQGCTKNPPPVRVESPTTHEHELHLVPRRIDFTCNACGTLGDRSPYFCLQCNFMIHWECIDLPRVININHHDHRISYTRRLGNGEWKCKVCRKKVDRFYGAYTCVKCPSFHVHSRCATSRDVWDKIELEETPEEEKEIAPFEVIEDNTIKHFSHDHNLLQINKDGYDRIQPENIVCEACRFQILSEPFYSCKQCNFILHEKCANHPRKKRHVRSNLPFTLLTDSRHEVGMCRICYKDFTGFRYKAIDVISADAIIDLRCAAISDTLEHESHRHPLYYCKESNNMINCSVCGIRKKISYFRCDDCDYTLGGECAQIPQKVMKIRYDDHPLVLSFGDIDVEGEYWCEACETKVDPKKWFYTCNDCGTILHTSCVVGDFSYIMPGSQYSSPDGEVVSNTSIWRPFCFVCNCRCKLHSILKISIAAVEYYFCSSKCSYRYYQKMRREAEKREYAKRRNVTEEE